MTDLTTTATAALTPPTLTADPQWSNARIVGHVRLPTHEMRWIVEQADGTQHRVVAVVVQDDWETPHIPVEVNGRECVTKDWYGLMAILDDIYPASIFTGASGDPGPLIVTHLREIARLRRNA